LLLKTGQKTELAEITAPYAGLPLVTKLGAMSQMIAAAESAAPGMQVKYVVHLFGPIWTAPIVLGVLTVSGLVSALLGDGVWDALSAVSLGVVTAVGGWHGLRRPNQTMK